MDRLAELAGYAQSFPGMVDEDFIAAGFTPEEVSSYRSQTDPQRMTPEEISLMADRYGTLQEPDYTLRERAVQGSQDILSNTFGMNPYNAGVLSRNVLGDPNSSGSNYGMGLADFTPLGALFAVQEGSRTASRGYEAGDPVQMGLGGLEVLLGVAEGVPLAGAAARPLSKAVINTVEEVFDTPFGGEVLGYLRGVRDLDADFLRGRGDPAQAQGVGADVPGRPPLTFDEVEAAMAETPVAALPLPKTPSEALARDILELRAAGRADEVTDQMMAQADDQYMFYNTPPDLPMDEASRSARRDAMSRRDDYYHGTNADIDAFQGNVFSSDNPTLASTYAKGMTDAQIYPLSLGSKLGDTVVEGGGVNWNQLDPDEIYKTDPAVAGWLGYDEVADSSGRVSTRAVERAAMYEGRSGVQFKNINDLGSGFNSNQFKNLGYTKEQERALQRQYMEDLSKPSNVDVRLSPNLVRSKFARFDPKFAHLKNLSAGVGGVAVLSSIGEDAEAGTVTETVSSIKEKYPLFSDIEVRDLRDQGVQDGRRLEFTEAYDDRVDSPLIEIFDPDLQGDELEQAIIGEFLHEAPRRIPEYAELREKLQELKTPQQLQDDMNSYLYDVENYGENRPFEKWDEVSRKDAFIRGHAVGQWEPEYYTDEQKALIDEMMGLIRSGANK
jgi:hypothetical protein